MVHLFRATPIGYNKGKEGVWFDSAKFSREEAEAQFVPYEGTTQRGYPYTGYEYGGKKYHDYQYLGEFENNKMPKDDIEFMDAWIQRIKKARVKNN